MTTAAIGGAYATEARPLWQGRVRVGTLRHAFWAAFGIQAALGNAWSLAFGLPGALKWLDEGVLVVLTGLLLLRTLAIGRLPTWKLAASWPFAAFTLVAVASGAINDTPVVEILLGWRSLAQFFLFYLVLVWLDFGLQDVGHLFDGFLVASLVHVPLALRQLRAAPAGVLGIDYVTGGFGAGTANLMGYFCGLIVVVCICVALVAGRRRYWLAAAPIGLVWPLTSAIGSYIAFGLVAVLALIVSPEFRRFRRALRLAAVIGIGAVCLSYFVSSHFRVSLASALVAPIRALTQHRIDTAGNPGRLALMYDTAALVAEEDRTLFFGLGTGSVATLLGGPRPSNFQRLSARTGTQSVFASIIGYFAELGLVGLIVILLAWAQIGWVAWRAWRRSEDRLERAWLQATVLVVPFVVLAGCGEVTWTFQPVMYPIAALAAFATVRRASHRRRRPDAITSRVCP
jgi:hypothetical protein